jgi:aspartate-semialdehyde dehydrogenase
MSNVKCPPALLRRKAKRAGQMSNQCQNPNVKVKLADIKISASCQRVCTVDGHMEDLHIGLKQSASIDEIKKVLYNFGSNFNNLPTAPNKTLIVTDDPLRPQPKLDRNAGAGMSITIGRIRHDPVLENGVKMTILGHNTIRGAAGQSILNAERWATSFANDVVGGKSLKCKVQSSKL